MRTFLAVAIVLSSVACTSARGPRGAAATADLPAGEPTAPPADSPAAGSRTGGPSGAPSAPWATGPIEASALARQTGLRYEDSTSSVLLVGDDVRVRFFPGSDKVSVDGRSKSMGEAAKREGAGLMIPAAGADAVRRAVTEASERKRTVALAAAPRWPTLPPVPTPTALKPVTLAPPALHSASGDPAWVPSCSERSWRYIVIHHSDDHEGCCAKYDRVHLQKGWENGCGYHFIIGNGSMTGDGQVETGPRWSRQIQGAHAKTADNCYNDFGIGIVLVGDFEHGGRPTAAQYDALVNLTRWLMTRYGVPASGVMRHSDCKSTACPGKNFPWARYLADVSSTSVASR